MINMSAGLTLPGEKVVLRAATEADRQNVYVWLACSDITPAFLGPPGFPDNPVPSWEEFCEDYRPHYFNDSKPEQGRCFIIMAGGEDVGVICYNTVRAGGFTGMDVWLRSLADCGKSYGTDALRTLSDYLHRRFSLSRVVISPSARNERAVAAYRKAGFEAVSPERESEFLRPEDREYKDHVVMVREF